MKIGVLLFTFLLSASLLQAKVYKWVDEEGVTHYSQKAPEEGAKEIRVKGVPSGEYEAPVQSAAANSSGPTALNCDQAVRHGLKLMKEKYKKENDKTMNLKIAILEDPRVIADGVADCEKDKSKPKEAAEWLCQQNAKSFDEVLACERS
ncbi:MAG: DUF4124 domain-containing protein [Xanthomonadales bacterium]|nr:DUF4124 domain-containing protein [Xanthomonadales bacterium]